MKKLLLFPLIFFLATTVSAKVISTEVVKDLSQVTLKNGSLFNVCEMTSSSSTACNGSKDLILAELEYTYSTNKSKYTDMLFVLDNTLYRPDDVKTSFDSKTQDQTSATSTNLWKIDTSAPDGQVSAPGNIKILYGPNKTIMTIELTLNGKLYTTQIPKNQLRNTPLFSVIK